MVSWSKEHFETVARILASYDGVDYGNHCMIVDSVIDSIAKDFVFEFTKANNNFDEERFWNRCKYYYNKKKI